ncbi:MAG: sucrose-6-phosphate hydrolase [Frankia sp.]
MTTPATPNSDRAPIGATPGSGGAGSWLVACDLDQTLIYSRRSFRLDPALAEPDLTLVERLDGSPVTYMTRSGVDLLGRLAAVVPVVPVTTRTYAQYRRVDLGLRPRYAVTTNGGQLLVDGVPDGDWATTVQDRLAATSRPLDEILTIAERLGAQDWVRLVRVADDLFIYLVAYERDGIPDLEAVARDLAAAGWTLSVQGRKVYLVPATLTKRSALAEVARRLGTSRIAAAGDSLLDRPMLADADLAVRPSHGELHELGWTASNLRVVPAVGLAAGVAILTLLADAVGVAPTVAV